MATHAQDAQICKHCEKPAVKGTRVRNGLCKPCRESAATTPQSTSRPVATAAAVVKKSGVLLPFSSGAQLTFPAVARQDVIVLRRQIRQLEGKVRQLYWLIDGVLEGNITRANAKTLLGDPPPSEETEPDEAIGGTGGPA
jgi:hypothetical protein